MPNLLNNNTILHVSSGRSAIALALENANIGEGDEVLVPAFHCESMVSPIHWRGASPVFYRVNSDTEVDLQDIEQKFTANTRALLVTHYFGWLQPMDLVTELCQRYGIILIEDCAHAFFGRRASRHVGSWGDYAIGSSMKFFPVFDGGILASSSKSLDEIVLSKPSVLFQVKSLVNIVQLAIRYRRLGILGHVLNLFLSAAEKLWVYFKKISGRQDTGIHSPSAAGGGYNLDEAWIHKRSSWISMALIEHEDLGRICEKRRANYQWMLNTFENLPGCRPLHSKLPDGVVPLVFPLYIEKPDLHFNSLKTKGVPIWRFGEFLDHSVTADVCPSSVDLSAHVFQFPCHQELNAEELDWLISTVCQQLNEHSARSDSK